MKGFNMEVGGSDLRTGASIAAMKKAMQTEQVMMSKILESADTRSLSAPQGAPSPQAVQVANQAQNMGMTLDIKG